MNLLTVVEGNLALGQDWREPLVRRRAERAPLARHHAWKERLTKHFRRKMGLEKHHRLPSSHGGRNNKRNISYLPPLLHWAWHLLFENCLAERIAAEMTERYIEPDVTLLVMRDGKITYPVMPSGVTILIVKDGQVIESVEGVVAV